ncbi:MAG TPA: UDP-3-O-(3-hydroxymyristoyl)glucosamine N-acyltransferase [Bacteroidales bacterium]|nr:UDP-3-O-(3-hydroxymyristoyl)glucosamine N-acyltransferase [Bacteroidales bacterium]HPS17130.1 UDP-3-O-(3-hydroxymyristoyl)glucosamine N-acyltransferase [Bacteroidales bacterium]
MKFSAKHIAELLNGNVEGNENAEVSRLSKIEEGSEGSLSFLANPKYTQYIYNTKASIVIVNKDFIPEQKISSTLIRVEDAYQAFAKLLEIYNQIKLNKAGISKHAFISETAKIGKNVYIGEFAVIGENVLIGDNVKIYPQTYIGDNSQVNENTLIYAGVKIYTDIHIGKNCTVHSGVVIGGDGFGFAQEKAGNNYIKVTQIGNVIIEDDVEIGANTTIDRATMGSTIIRKGAKLDNLIQIAHNVEIGENTVIVSQAGIAGSTKIGKNCMIGGQVGIIGHLHIADNVKIAAQSGIQKNINDEGAIIQGSPAFNVHDYQKSYVLYKKLPSLYKRLDELEQKLKESK